MKIVTFSATIETGAEDLAETLVEDFQTFADENYSGPGRLITIQEYSNKDAIKATAFGYLANVFKTMDKIE